MQAIDARGVDGREGDGDGGDQRGADGPYDVGKDVLYCSLDFGLANVGFSGIQFNGNQFGLSFGFRFRH